MVRVGLDKPDQIRQSVQAVRKYLGTPPEEPVQVGMGFLGWALDISEASENPCIPAFLDELPTAIWFAFGSNLEKHIQTVRRHQADKEHKTKVFVSVNTLEEALTAAHEWKVDVIALQGQISHP
jgi:nitronate monooxygenase